MLLVLAVSSCRRQVQPGQLEAVRVSGIDVDAAEPAIAARSDGTINVVWVEHHSDGGADIMLDRFDRTETSTGSAVRINPQGDERLRGEAIHQPWQLRPTERSMLDGQPKVRRNRT